MGIYPSVWFFDEESGHVISAEMASRKEKFIMVRKEPGLTTKLHFTRETVLETRDDCFCCSCGDQEGSDRSCRNHGNDLVGRRPCEVHNMPGSADDEGRMPDSVQKARTR